MHGFRFLIATLLFALGTKAHAQVQFNIAFDATAAPLNSTERAAIAAHVQSAGALWIRELDINASRSIEVEIGLDDTRPTANGGSVTSVFVGIVSGRDMFEQGMAGELRTGIDPNNASPDVRITFNTNYLRNELWFDPSPTTRTAPVPVDRTDAMSIFLHEFGHALAYNGFANLSTGQPPATFWSPFDRWMLPGNPVRFNGPRVLANFGSAPDLTFNNIFHWANSGLTNTVESAQPVFAADIIWDDQRPRPRLSHCEHVSISQEQIENLPRGIRALIDELMNGVVYLRGNRYAISALDRALLDDVGVLKQLLRNGFE